MPKTRVLQLTLAIPIPARRDYYGGPSQHYPPPGSDQYQPPPDGQYSPGPVYSPPPDKPPLPQGWVPQFDREYARWYYFDQATGRSQWEAPGYVPPRPPLPGADRAYGSGYGGGQGGGVPQSSGRGKMMLAAAGGAVAGAAAGALLAHALGMLFRQTALVGRPTNMDS